MTTALFTAVAAVALLLASARDDRRNAQEAARKAAVVAQRELAYAAATARDFADSETAGYIDRTGLES